MSHCLGQWISPGVKEGRLKGWSFGGIPSISRHSLSKNYRGSCEIESYFSTLPKINNKFLFKQACTKEQVLIFSMSELSFYSLYHKIVT